MINTLEKRKSIRGYLNQPVETEKLSAILKYGMKASSNDNINYCD